MSRAKIMAVLICLTSMSAFGQTNGFQTYLGCYETQKLNGMTYKTYFEISEGKSFYFLRNDGLPIKSIELSFLAPGDESQGVELHYAFLDRGVFSDAKNGADCYNFDGPVKYISGNRSSYNLRVEICLQSISSGLVIGSIKRIFDLTQLNRSISVVLKKVSCN